MCACVRVCKRTQSCISAQEREREKGGEFRCCLVAKVRNSRGELLERNAPSGNCPEFPPLFGHHYLFPSSTLTHQRILHLPPTFFLSYPPSSRCFVSSFPGMYAKMMWKEKREGQRGTRKADEWRDILLKTKRRGWNKYASVRSSPSPLLFLSVFIFFLFFPPPFFVSRRDRSTSVSFCSSLFFLIYLPFPYSHPRMNEERTITFCFRLEHLPPPSLWILQCVLFAF